MAEQGPDEIAFRTSPSPDRDRPGSSPSDPSELSSAVSPKFASYSVDLNRLLGTLKSEHRAWHVRPLDVGRVTGTFIVRAPDHASIFGEHRALVIKLHAPAFAPPIGTVLGPYQALRNLHAQLGYSGDGWTINIPEPLHVSKTALGLVMTVAPGPLLNICLEGECWNVPLLISAARAIVIAMENVWLSGELQGDLIFQNIICDVDRRSISFVDAGVMPNCHFAGPGTRWHPAVHDLALILSDVSTALRDALLKAGHKRKRMFAESLVTGSLTDHGSAEEQQILLDQLYECTRLHVQAKAPDWPSLGLAHDHSNTDEYENTTKWMSSLNVC